MNCELQPAFLGIGAQKAGTSWLYRQLVQHPELWLPPVKELHYFDRSRHYPTSNYLADGTLLTRLSNTRGLRQTARGATTVMRYLLSGRRSEAAWWARWSGGNYSDQWYRSLFTQGAKRGLKCGEITPSYSMLETTDIEKMHKLNPNTKLIFLIRHPVDRIWSAIRYNAHVNERDIASYSEAELIRKASAQDVESRTDYIETLKRYAFFFPRDQILIGFYDAIVRDPVGLLHSIHDFLDVKPVQDFGDLSGRINSSPKRDMPAGLETFLEETYASMISTLAQVFGSYAEEWHHKCEIETPMKPSLRFSEAVWKTNA